MEGYKITKEHKYRPIEDFLKNTSNSSKSVQREDPKFNELETLNNLLYSIEPGEDLSAKETHCRLMFERVKKSNEIRKLLDSQELIKTMQRVENSLKLLQNILSNFYTLEEFNTDVGKLQANYPTSIFCNKFYGYSIWVSKIYQSVQIITGSDLPCILSLEEVWIRKYLFPAIGFGEVT